MAEYTRRITSGNDKDRFQATVNLYVSAFATDPVITYLLCSIRDEAVRKAYFPEYFYCLLKAASLNDAIFDEVSEQPEATAETKTTQSSTSSPVDEYQCAAVLMKPGKRVDNVWTLIPAGFFSCLWKLGWSGCQKMLIEYTSKSDRVKAKAVSKKEEFYYVFFIATREDCRGKGLCSSLIRHHQTLASKTGHAIWLEATTSKSRDVYARLGFAVVDDFVIGCGKVGADGKPKAGGEGVTVWGMVWRPGNEETVS